MKLKITIYAIILLLIDIISKLIINNVMAFNETINIINNFFSLTKVYNEGASFSIMPGFSWIFIIVGIVVVIYIYQNLDKVSTKKINIISASLLLGGVVGNLIDRIIYGYVIDFLDFKFWGYDFPVFNMADIFIVSGALLIIFELIKNEVKNEDNSK